MSRMSPEAKAAANFRAGSQYQRAPRWMSDEESIIWQEVLKSKPKDFFDSAQLRILAQLCSALAEAKRMAIILQNASFDTMRDRIEVVKALTLLNGNCSTLATKLRLTVQQGVESRAGKLDEKGDSDPDDGLLGGSKWGVAQLRAVQ